MRKTVIGGLLCVYLAVWCGAVGSLAVFVPVWVAFGGSVRDFTFFYVAPLVLIAGGAVGGLVGALVAILRSVERRPHDDLGAGTGAGKESSD